MGTLIQVRGRKAFLRQGAWRSSDARMEETLNRLTEEWIRECGGPPLAAPDPEYMTAQEIARRAGGKVLLHAPGSPRDLQKQYFERRQYRLPFATS